MYFKFVTLEFSVPLMCIMYSPQLHKSINHQSCFNLILRNVK